MSIPLEEVLRHADLKEGQTYHCQVNGKHVVVRVLDKTPRQMPPGALQESDIHVMYEPWIELPLPEGGFLVHPRPGPLDPPDIPEIPEWEEEP